MIEIIKLKKQYEEKVALAQVNLKIEDSQVIGILGENGAGKTTLLKCLAGLTDYEGEIRYEDVTTIKERSAKIAYMTEEGSYFPFMTALENALFLEDFYECFDLERFKKLCEFLDLPMKQKARTLSKGQKAKLEIALGFSKGAKYLLLDEPFLGNDIFTRRNFLKMMCDSLIQNETIVIATHLIDEIENFIDRAVLIRKGDIIEDVMVEELHERGENLEVLMKKAFEYDEERYRKIFA